MKINAVLDGNVVTIGQVDVLGTDILITFTDTNNAYGYGTNALLVTKRFFSPLAMNTVTSAGAFIPAMICTSGNVIS